MSYYGGGAVSQIEAAAAARKDERFKLERRALDRFIPLRNISSLFIFLLIATFVVGAVVGTYYHGAIGDRWGLTVMNYFVGGFLYAAYCSSQFGLNYINVVRRIIGYILAILLAAVYVAFQGIAIMHCNDPEYRAEHPSEDMVCTDSYGAMIGVLVYVCVQIVLLIALVAIDGLLCKPARELTEFDNEEEVAQVLQPTARHYRSDSKFKQQSSTTQRSDYGSTDKRLLVSERA